MEIKSKILVVVGLIVGLTFIESQVKAMDRYYISIREWRPEGFTHHSIPIEGNITAISVRNLKQKIQAKSGIPIEEQHLIIYGKELQNDELLSKGELVQLPFINLDRRPEPIR